MTLLNYIGYAFRSLVPGGRQKNLVLSIQRLINHYPTMTDREAQKDIAYSLELAYYEDHITTAYPSTDWTFLADFLKDVGRFHYNQI